MLSTPPHSAVALSAAACLVVFAHSLPEAAAGTMSSSAALPPINGADIANLSAPGGDPAAYDPGGDQGHIWSNRPTQGQTFTTGSNPAGYLLRSVSLQNEENTNTGNTATFTVRVGTVSGTALRRPRPRHVVELGRSVW
ncbi:MAG: hypothetical protein R3F11_29085 [Verrucomicrobiales bacterium]